MTNIKKKKLPAKNKNVYPKKAKVRKVKIKETEPKVFSIEQPYIEPIDISFKEAPSCTPELPALNKDTTTDYKITKENSKFDVLYLIIVVGLVVSALVWIVV